MARRLPLCIAVFVLCAFCADGKTRTLTSVTDGNWDDPSSWVEILSGHNAVPTPEDVVVINSHTIVMTRHGEVAGFHLKDGTLDLGTHALITDGGGQWDRGVITGPGGFNNKGELRLAASLTKTLQGVFNNWNRIIHHDRGDLNLAYRAVLVNREGAIYDLQSDANITGLARWDATPKFLNRGIFRKTGGAATSRLEIVFRNQGGTIEVLKGTLSLAGTGGAGSVSSNGWFHVAKGAVLDLGGVNFHVFNGRYEGGGDGSIEFSRGTLLVGTDFGDTRFQFSGGGFCWKGGTIDPVMGPLVNDGMFTLEGAAVKNMGAGPAFRNAGTVIHKGTGNLNLEYGGMCHNARGAIYEIQGDAGITASGGEGPIPLFMNYGTFRKSSGTGIATVHAEYRNMGAVEVASGMLNFNDAYVQRSGVTRLAGGSVASSAPLDIRGGTLTGAGKVFASVRNAAVLAPGSSAGTLTINGGYSQNAEGTIEIEVGGPTAGVDYDQLRVTGYVSLDGVLRVELVRGFMPKAGDTFEIITYRGHSGAFAETYWPELAAGLEWSLAYGEKGVRLSVVAP